MIEQIPQINSGQKVESESEKERVFETARTKINVIFDSHETGEQRVDDLKSQIDETTFLENKEAMKKELEMCIGINTKKEFIDAAFKIIKPIVDLRLERPELFVREGGPSREFFRINELLSYEINRNTLYIHVIPEEKVKHFLIKLREGLQKLAGIVDGNTDIEVIEGESWIVAKHLDLIEKLGFIIDGEINEEDRETHYPGEKGRIFKAHISRDDFLKKYLS